MSQIHSNLLEGGVSLCSVERACLSPQRWLWQSETSYGSSLDITVNTFRTVSKRTAVGSILCFSCYVVGRGIVMVSKNAVITPSRGVRMVSVNAEVVLGTLALDDMREDGGSLGAIGSVPTRTAPDGDYYAVYADDASEVDQQEFTFRAPCGSCISVVLAGHFRVSFLRAALFNNALTGFIGLPFACMTCDRIVRNGCVDVVCDQPLGFTGGVNFGGHAIAGRVTLTINVPLRLAPRIRLLPFPFTEQLRHVQSGGNDTTWTRAVGKYLRVPTPLSRVDVTPPLNALPIRAGDLAAHGRSGYPHACGDNLARFFEVRPWSALDISDAVLSEAVPDTQEFKDEWGLSGGDVRLEAYVKHEREPTLYMPKLDGVNLWARRSDEGGWEMGTKDVCVRGGIVESGSLIGNMLYVCLLQFALNFADRDPSFAQLLHGARKCPTRAEYDKLAARVELGEDDRCATDIINALLSYMLSYEDDCDNISYQFEFIGVFSGRFVDYFVGERRVMGAFVCTGINGQTMVSGSPIEAPKGGPFSGMMYPAVFRGLISEAESASQRGEGVLTMVGCNVVKMKNASWMAIAAGAPGVNAPFYGVARQRVVSISSGELCVRDALLQVINARLGSSCRMMSMTCDLGGSLTDILLHSGITKDRPGSVAPVQFRIGLSLPQGGTKVSVRWDGDATDQPVSFYGVMMQYRPLQPAFVARPSPATSVWRFVILHGKAGFKALMTHLGQTAVANMQLSDDFYDFNIHAPRFLFNLSRVSWWDQCCLCGRFQFETIERDQREAFILPTRNSIFVTKAPDDRGHGSEFIYDLHTKVLTLSGFRINVWYPCFRAFDTFTMEHSVVHYLRRHFVQYFTVHPEGRIIFYVHESVSTSVPHGHLSFGTSPRDAYEAAFGHDSASRLPMQRSARALSFSKNGHTILSLASDTHLLAYKFLGMGSTCFRRIGFLETVSRPMNFIASHEAIEGSGVGRKGVLSAYDLPVICPLSGDAWRCVLCVADSWGIQALQDFGRGNFRFHARNYCATLQRIGTREATPSTACAIATSLAIIIARERNCEVIRGTMLHAAAFARAFYGTFIASRLVLEGNNLKARFSHSLTGVGGVAVFCGGLTRAEHVSDPEVVIFDICTSFSDVGRVVDVKRGVFHFVYFEGFPFLVWSRDALSITNALVSSERAVPSYIQSYFLNFEFLRYARCGNVHRECPTAADSLEALISSWEGQLNGYVFNFPQQFLQVAIRYAFRMSSCACEPTALRERLSEARKGNKIELSFSGVTTTFYGAVAMTRGVLRRTTEIGRYPHTRVSTCSVLSGRGFLYVCRYANSEIVSVVWFLVDGNHVLSDSASDGTFLLCEPIDPTRPFLFSTSGCVPVYDC
uniref:Uncharacterized protein n=1 Tax=Leptomonas pyrrhocoris ostravirus TaxID=3070843 RepID=A0AA50KIG4_9VIRU|nr:hypothetical protein [Leptomonas pyrrhocoris ostravirus]